MKILNADLNEGIKQEIAMQKKLVRTFEKELEDVRKKLTVARKDLKVKESMFEKIFGKNRTVAKGGQDGTENIEGQGSGTEGNAAVGTSTKAD